MGKLSIQKELFCNEYLIDFNGTQAAIRAKYSAKTAKQQSSLLLTSIDIREKISELINDKLGTEKDTLRLKVITELSSIAFNEQEAKNSDRIKSLELLGKYGALWNDNNNINVNVNPDTSFEIVKANADS